MEQTNFRYLKPEDVPEKLDFVSVDVSFISLTKILIPARNLLKVGGEMVCLIKPQFEAGREKVGKNGVVRELSTHREVIEKVIDFADLTGFSVMGLEYSPIKGPEGNIEYLVYLKKEAEPEESVSSLTEREAEELLATVISEKKGLSSSEQWKQTIAGIVENSHAL
jgi:23S rRNA (cytidine1920-2'-O)/16S rRNA (cytidine1409-2'-O)-methyltransferase